MTLVWLFLYSLIAVVVPLFPSLSDFDWHQLEFYSVVFFVFLVSIGFIINRLSLRLLSWRQDCGRRLIYVHQIFFSAMLVVFSISYFVSNKRGELLFFHLTLLLMLLAAFHFVHFLWRKKYRYPNDVLLQTMPFFFSGFAALIYQVVWQRALYAAFGINIESVTIITAVFMFGLGFGSLVGGWLSRHSQERGLKYFAWAELVLAIFGAASLRLVNQAGLWFSPHSMVELTLAVFAILFLPTFLMGLTFPLLVQFFIQQRNHGHKLAGDVGSEIVSLLYALNTFGASFASLLTVVFLFPLLGLYKSCLVAVFFNLLAAMLALKQKATPEVAAQAVKFPSMQSVVKLPMLLIYLYSFLSGFISLSLEILWFRFLGVLILDKPQGFGVLLSVYLLGIAVGSLKNKVDHVADNQGSLQKLMLQLIFGGAILMLGFWLVALVAKFAGLSAAFMAAMVVVFALAYCWGGILMSLVAMVDLTKENSGQRISRLYVVNICGSTLGPLLTAFYLLDQFSFDQVRIILSLVCLVSATVLMFYWRRWFALSLVLFVSFAASLFLEPNLSMLYQGVTGKTAPRYLIEKRTGVVASIADENGDIIYGGGVYDGRVNIDLEKNSNGIDRAYFIARMHAAPKRLLEIGLSAGAWMRVFTCYQKVESLISVEISSAYYDLIKLYPEVSPILFDKRVEHIMDDGRRWLRVHADEKFDMIVMNTTFHWRSNATNLLSQQYFELLKTHLLPNGVIYFNTTGSMDVVKTVRTVFPYEILYGNFAAASMQPFLQSADVSIANLKDFKNEQGLSMVSEQWQQKFIATNPKYFSQAELEKYTTITDDNMQSEFSSLKFW